VVSSSSSKSNVDTDMLGADTLKTLLEMLTKCKLESKQWADVD
jgi:hypothetical protein